MNRFSPPASGGAVGNTLVRAFSVVQDALYQNSKMADSSCTPFKPVPPTLKADIWAHFGFHCKPGTNEEVDKTKVVCKHCHTVLKYCNNTINLRNHLARHHADLMQAWLSRMILNRHNSTKPFTANFLQAPFVHRR